MRINHNLPAMNTWRQLQQGEKNASTAMEKLSSGYRINRAGDDAAGLAISEKMRAQIRGLTMASKNTQDGISLIQTAEGALQEAHNILQRMRELSVQSSSDTNESTIDRAALDAEFQQLKAELDSSAQTTSFNNIKLLDGSLSKSTTAGNMITTITQASAGSATISVTDSVAEGNYTITAGYVAKGSVSSGLSAPIITVGALALTGTHGITLKGVQFSSTSGPEDWLGYDWGNAVGGGIIHDGKLTTIGFQPSVIHSLSDPDRDRFPLSIVPITIDDSNKSLAIHVTSGYRQEAITLDTGTYTTTQELADAINQAVERHNQEKGTNYQPVASVDGNGRIVWDNKDISFADTGNFYTYLCNNKKLYLDSLSTSESMSCTDFNIAQKIELTDGTRTITMTFSGTLDSLDNLAVFANDITRSLVNGTLFSATQPQQVDDPPKAYYEIGINNETVKVFDGQTSVTAGGVTLNFGGPVTVPETGGSASGLDALLGDKKFSVSRAAGEPSTGQALVLQTGANQGDTLDINIGAMNAVALGVDQNNIAAGQSARDAITACDKAVNIVSTERAHLGAMQNRLTHKTQNLDTSAENLTAAESRIRDVDMAKEMAAFTKHNIITQAATAMLAQANSQPQQVLQLLG